MMNKNELNDFFDTISLSENRKNEILQGITAKKRIRKTPILIAAALLLVFTTLTALASGINWHEKLIEYFSPTENQQENLSPALNHSVVTAEDNGVKATVHQTIADGHAIYILYEIAAPSGFEFSEKTRWEKNHLLQRYNAEDRLPGNGGGAVNKLISYNKNHCTMLYIRYGKGKVNSQQLKFTLSNIGYYNIDDEQKISGFITQIPCTITLEWDFNYQDLGNTISVNKAIEIDEQLYLWRDMYISPISLLINIQGENISGKVMPKITLNNGEIIQPSCTDTETTFFYSEPGDNINTIYYSFGRIIESSEIKTITIDDVTVNLN